jgi:ABC-type phosphate transport system permease subunit
MVYMTTMLLLSIVLLMNLAAILIRNRLRKRLQVSAV